MGASNGRYAAAILDARLKPFVEFGSVPNPVRPVGKIRAKSATGINSYGGRVVQVGIDSGFRSVG
jgi:hypothetical protein